MVFSPLNRIILISISSSRFLEHFRRLLGYNSLRISWDDLFQEGVQSAQSLRAVIDTKRPNLTPLFINDQGVMMVIGPVNTDIPHQKHSSLYTWFLSTRALILWRSKRDSLMIGSAQERCQGSASFLNRSSRVEELDFPWRVQQLYRTSVALFQPCVERACS